MVRRELTHLYQTALESVVTDKALIDKLGDPIETAIDSDELFRREGMDSLDSLGVRAPTGAWDPQGERLRFDVQGPRGTGQVAVVSNQGGSDGLQPAKITVTLRDGSSLEVRPLQRSLPPVR
jgi:hypothetical protein